MIVTPAELLQGSGLEEQPEALRQRAYQFYLQELHVAVRRRLMELMPDDFRIAIERAIERGEDVAAHRLLRRTVPAYTVHVSIELDQLRERIRHEAPGVLLVERALYGIAPHFARAFDQADR